MSSGAPGDSDQKVDKQRGAVVSESGPIPTYTAPSRASPLLQPIRPRQRRGRGTTRRPNFLHRAKDLHAQCHPNRAKRETPPAQCDSNENPLQSGHRPRSSSLLLFVLRDPILPAMDSKDSPPPEQPTGEPTSPSPQQADPSSTSVGVLPGNYWTEAPIVRLTLGGGRKGSSLLIRR